MKIYKHYTDNELISLHRIGDRFAFDVLVQRRNEDLRLYIYCNCECPVSNVDDFVQETWIKAYLNLHQYKEGKFRAWLNRIAYNLYKDSFRTQKLAVEYNEQIKSNDYTDEAKPLIEYKEQERALSIMWNAVDMLPVKQRDVVVLRVKGNYEYKQIGKITGDGFNTSLGRMRYAKMKLNNILSMKSQLTSF